jgi:serine/threonine protein kinase
MKIDVGTKITSNVSGKSYKLSRRIGGGSFGDVFSAFMYPTETKVAMKVIKVTGSKEHVQEIIRETEIMRKANDICTERVPKFHEAFKISTHNIFDKSHTICIVMDFIDGVSAAELVLNLRVMNESVALYVVYEVARALEKLHSRGLIHRDIKAANVMIDKQGKVYVCDFGVSKA